MSQENLEIIRRFGEYTEREGEPLWEVIDPAIELRDDSGIPDMAGVVYRGHEGYARLRREWRHIWQEWHTETEQYVDAGDKIVEIVRVRGIGRGSGVRVARREALVYKLRAGKIIRIDYYDMPERALEEAGLKQAAQKSV